MSIARAFDKLIARMFIRYKGCLISRESEGFKVFKQTYPTIEQAKKAVDESLNTFNNILKRNA